MHQGSSDPRSSALRHLMRALVPETPRVISLRVQQHGRDIHALGPDADGAGVTGALSRPRDALPRHHPDEAWPRRSGRRWRDAASLGPERHNVLTRLASRAARVLASRAARVLASRGA